jgi:TPR repeat protein
MNNLAVMYRHGYGVEQDYRAALEWYGRALEAGFGNAGDAIQEMVRAGNVSAADAAAWLG